MFKGLFLELKNKTVVKTKIYNLNSSYTERFTICYNLIIPCANKEGFDSQFKMDSYQNNTY